MRKIPEKTRKAIVASIAKGASQKDAAEKHGVSISTVYNLKREMGVQSARPRGRPPSKTGAPRSRGITKTTTPRGRPPAKTTAPHGRPPAKATATRGRPSAKANATRGRPSAKTTTPRGRPPAKTTTPRGRPPAKATEFTGSYPIRYASNTRPRSTAPAKRSVRKKSTKTKTTIATLENTNMGKADGYVDEGWLERAIQRRQAHRISKCAQTPKSRVERHIFADTCRWMTVHDWARVIWTEVVRIPVPGTVQSTVCWVDVGTPRSMIPSVDPTIESQFLAVWSCMTYEGVGYICKLDDDIDKDLYVEILEDELLRTISHYKMSRTKAIIQQCNAPMFKAKVVDEWFEQNKIQTLCWPCASSDLNPLAEIWAYIRDEINYYGPYQPKNISDLWEQVQRLWRDIDKDTCQDAIGRLPLKLEHVREHN